MKKIPFHTNLLFLNYKNFSMNFCLKHATLMVYALMLVKSFQTLKN